MPMHAFAMADVERPDLTKFPAMARATGMEVHLEAGDTLWLPCHWWHYVKQLPGETLSINFWLGARRSDREQAMLRAEQALNGRSCGAGVVAEAAKASAADANAMELKGGEAADDELLPVTGEDGVSDDGLLSMQMARHVERESARIHPTKNDMSGAFLTAIAAGADAVAWPAEAEATRFAAQLREHMVNLLGAPRANALLRAMTRDGRLHPGLAPKLKGKVTGTEEQQLTPTEDLRRLKAARGASFVA